MTIMKINLVCIGFLWATILLWIPEVHAQNKGSQDTTARELNLEPTLGKKDYDYRGEAITYPRVFGGLTFTRIDWGFSRLVDNGSFTMGEENQLLESIKDTSFGSDIAQIGVRFNDAVKVYTSAGFECNYLRLKNVVILDTESTPLSYRLSDITYKKNILTSTYLRIPLSFEWRGRKNQRGHRPKIAFGA